MLLLFQAIKERSPSTEIQALMSDDGNIISEDNYLQYTRILHVPNIVINFCTR